MEALSYSRISLYRSCPLCYKLRYIDGLKPQDKWYFSFGRTMHSCAEYFYKVRVPPPPSLDELLAFYENNWVSGGYDSPEEEARYRAYGRAVLTDFWKTQSRGFRMPLAVEKMFYVDVGGVTLHGYIDRVDKLDSGGLAILDYKTDRELFTRERLETDLQLTLYQFAAGQLWRMPVEQLTLYHLRSNTPCHCPPRSQAQIDEACNTVLEVASNIAAGKFPAIESSTCPCDYPEHCPYYRQSAVTELKEPGILEEMTPGEAVERYVQLQSQLKELQIQRDEAKQALVRYCEAEGLSRVYGTEHAITLGMVDRTSFNEDEVRALLEPAGLWHLALGFDEARVKELIGDESVPRDLRRSLEALRRVLSSSPRLWVRRLGED